MIYQRMYQFSYSINHWKSEINAIISDCNYMNKKKRGVYKVKMDEMKNSERKRIVVTENSKAFFHNNVDYCVGTGRMGLALTEEYQEELRLVQKEIGFKHIRGHGLFCDDMAIFQTYEEDGEVKVEYNYTYLDRVMDAYKKVGLRPFLELGFMPDKLARGTQTIFYWKGNTTPPKNYDMWCDMVQSLLYHLMERYGAEEVVQWPIEVWNEPNLCGFWENADMEEYFRLFHKTFDAIKDVNSAFRVGGPAVCGGTDEIWIQAFMEYCHEHHIPVDFVTRHHYTIDPPECLGHYAYSELMKAEDGFANLKTTREIIDRFPEYRGLQIHITEFNTSYTPQGVIHDTNLNAAFVAQQLSRLGDVNESYSYWTFGDVFEEQGVPFTPFHGGFGLVANGCITKPTFWTFAFYKKLQESKADCVYKDSDIVILRRKNGDYLGVAFHVADKNTEPGKEKKSLELTLPVKQEEYCLLTQTVDEETCNPLKVWHDLGEPLSLNDEQLKLLRESSRPFMKTTRRMQINGNVSIELTLNENSVIYFELNACRVNPDRGYDYERVVSLKA